MTNLILKALPPDTSSRIAQRSLLVHLTAGEQLFTQGSSADYAWFIESGLVSVVAAAEDGSEVAVGAIGSEGIVGLSGVLGGARMGTSGIAQLSGLARRIEAEVLRQEMSASAELQRALLGFTEEMLIQVTQLAVSNARFGLTERLARWLLIMIDRSSATSFAVTHQALASALGVRRAGVTNALHILEGEQAIRSTRGRVTLRDRAALERIACNGCRAPARPAPRPAERASSAPCYA